MGIETRPVALSLIEACSGDLRKLRAVEVLVQDLIQQALTEERVHRLNAYAIQCGLHHDPIGRWRYYADHATFEGAKAAAEAWIKGHEGHWYRIIDNRTQQEVAHWVSPVSLEERIELLVQRSLKRETRPHD